MEENRDHWSKQDWRVFHSSGFKGAERSKRECTTCDQKGHYYYECNNGEFFNLADALAAGLGAINDNKDK